MLQIRFLGQFDVRVDGKTLAVPTRAAQSLFAFLVLNAGTPHRREKLAGMLWPDTPDENARRSLRQELWRLRKALAAHSTDEANALAADELTVSFLPRADFWFDVHQLEQPLAPDVPLNERINHVAVFQGELLPGFYQDWVLLERERVQVLYETQMRELLEHLILEKHWQSAVGWAEKWISFGQTPEAAYRALILTYAMLGDRAQAAAAYERCKIALEKDLSVEPSPETESLYQEILRGDTLARVNLNAPRVFIGASALYDEPPAHGEPPFKGLDFFDENDASLFYGREQVVEKLAQRVRAQNFLAVVVGASGSGKSSIVRAGLVPVLKNARLETGDWQIFVMTPTAHPLEALAVALTRDSESITATATLLDDLARDPRALQLFIRRQMTGDGAQTSAHPSSLIPHHLLVVDQFEELFTLCRDEFEREQFVDNLLDALHVETNQGASRTQLLTLVLTIRADFYSHLAQYPELREVVAKHQEYIGAMNVEELRRAIEEPAHQARWEFEPGLVDLMLRDVGDEPGALPLLSHALLETWKRRAGRMMTLKGYHEAGGVRGAIAQTAETTYEQLNAEQQQIARDIFLRLTELGVGTEDTRRRAEIRELETGDWEQTRRVLTLLADARLVTTHENFVEVAHEALIREWPRLREWLNQDREGLTLHRHLTEAANEWALMERDASALYRGARLAQAREWAVTNSERMNELERAFLEASEEQEKRESKEREEQRERELLAAQKLAETERRANKRLRRRALYLAGAGALAIALAIIAFVLMGVAQNQSAIAKASANQTQSLALSSAAQLSADRGNPELGLAYALAANRLSPPAIEAQAPLADLAYASGFQHQFSGGHESGVGSISFSPEGKTALSAGTWDNSFNLWNLSDGTLLRKFSPETGGVFSVSFSPDGKTALTAYGNGTVALWDTATWQVLREYHGHDKSIWLASFSKDGTRFLSASDDGPLILWDVASGEMIHRISGLDGLFTAALSPDARTALAGFKDGRIGVMDLATGQLVHTFQAHADAVSWLGFSPDGKTALSSSLDKTVALWDIGTGQLIRRMLGHKDAVYWVTYTPDGKTALSGGGRGTSFANILDKSMIWWDLESGEMIERFEGPQPSISTIASSPDGKTALSGSAGSLVLWQLGSGAQLHRLTEHTSAVHSVAFDANGARGISGGADGKIIVWDTTHGTAIRALKGESIVNTVASSPAGKNILSGAMDGTLTLWDADSGKVLRRFEGHDAPVTTVALSSDEKLALSGAIDHSLILWDVVSGKILHRLAGHTNAINSVAISPDGKRALTGGYDRAVILWDTQTGQLLKRFPTQASVVNAIAFSPNGKTALFALADGNIAHWDLERGVEILRLVGHDGAVRSVAFSPDGKSAISGGLDKRVIVWDVASGQAIRHLLGHADTVNSVVFSPDGKLALSGSVDETVRVWRIDSLDELMQWTRTHRVVSEIPCDKRALYGLAPLCDATNATPTPSP
jgi:WD40 repeat protein/DNA-binding SARP family transcriptional activator